MARWCLRHSPLRLLRLSSLRLLRLLPRPSTLLPPMLPAAFAFAAIGTRVPS